MVARDSILGCHQVFCLLPLFSSVRLNLERTELYLNHKRDTLYSIRLVDSKTRKHMLYRYEIFWILSPTYGKEQGDRGGLTVYRLFFIFLFFIFWRQ